VLSKKQLLPLPGAFILYNKLKIEGAPKASDSLYSQEITLFLLPFFEVIPAASFWREASASCVFYL
jgi:hypothetical protein